MSILGTKSPDGGFSLPPAEIERRSGVRLTEVTVHGNIVRGDDGKLKFETDHVETVVHYAGGYVPAK